MTIQDMHYDFKKKLDKIDSQQNKNLLIPEIDWVLNEAQEMFVKIVAFPKKYEYLGLRKSYCTHPSCATQGQTGSRFSGPRQN